MRSAWPSLPRDGVVAGVIAHADRGSQYTSNDYLDFCGTHQLRPSVGRVATCFDCEHDAGVVRPVSDPCLRLAGVPWR